jgi:hypothetical protein
MAGCDTLTSSQVRNRAGNPQGLVNGLRTEVQLLYDSGKQGAGGGLKRTEDGHVCWLDLCIAGKSGPGEPLELPLAGHLDPGTNRGRGLLLAAGAQ